MGSYKLYVALSSCCIKVQRLVDKTNILQKSKGARMHGIKRVMMHVDARAMVHRNSEFNDEGNCTVAKTSELLWQLWASVYQMIITHLPSHSGLYNTHNCISLQK